MDQRIEAATTDEAGIDTVLLDVDGTLVDSTYLHALAWSRAFGTVGLHPHWYRVHRAIGMGGDKLVAEVAGEGVEARYGDTLRTRWEEEYARVAGEVPAYDGAADLVREIRGSGLKVALASSGKQVFTDLALEVLGLGRDDVDAVTTADDAEESKPEPDILGVALDRAGGSRGVLVGDTTWDVAAATRAGMPCVTVLTGGFSEHELREAGAVAVVASVADLRGRDWRTVR